MRREFRGIVALAFTTVLTSTSIATAQQAKPKSAAPPAARPPSPAPPFDPGGAKMKQLLRRWEQESVKLSTLDVRIQRFDQSPDWGNEQFEGRAILKSPNLAWLDFSKVELDPKAGKFIRVELDRKTLKPVVDPQTKLPKITPHERIVCTGTEVWQYKSDTKQIFIFPLDKQDQKRALEEGPLPFLFNMRAQAAEARYQMDLMNETKDFYVISVIPKLKIDQEAFSKAFLGLNKTTYFPERINLVSPGGTSTKDFEITMNKDPNSEVADANFKGVPLQKPWTIVRDPADQELQPKSGQRPAQDVGNRQPAGGQGASAPARRK